MKWKSAFYLIFILLIMCSCITEEAVIRHEPLEQTIITEKPEETPVPTPVPAPSPVPVPEYEEQELFFDGSQKYNLLSKKEAFYAYNNSSESEYYRYNMEKQLIRTFSVDEKGPRILTARFYYDEEGRKIKEVKYHPSGQESRHIFYLYNEDGRLVRENYKNPAGEILYYTLYEYDEMGNLISEKIYDLPDERVVNSMIYKYNAKGLKVSFIGSYSEDYIYRKARYEYDEDDRLVKEPYYSNGEMGEFEGTLVYEYDSAGNRIKETDLMQSIEDSEIQNGSYTLFTYNPGGTLLKEEYFYGDKMSYRMTYFYE